MRKDIKINLIYCERHGCENMVGYAGAVVEHPLGLRRIICLPCLKDHFRGWKVLVEWREKS